MRAIVNPLAAGCSVILKTSEFSPKTHGMIAKLFYDAGLPAGVLNTVNVSTQDAPTVVKAIIEHPAVRKVNFTGSTRVGRTIAQLCASALKPVVLELGGKAPVVVADDADLDLAANNIVCVADGSVQRQALLGPPFSTHTFLLFPLFLTTLPASFGGLMNQGQICMSTANIIVQRRVLPNLEKKIAAIMQEHQQILQAGAGPNAPAAPDVKDHRLRALFTAAASERVKAMYDDAIAGGAKVVAGKPGFDTRLGLVQPVFLEGTPEMRIFGEEAFAPVLGLYAYDTDEEAAALANAPGAGLTASVFSKNESRAWAIARRIDSGAVHVNGITWVLSGQGQSLKEKACRNGRILTRRLVLPPPPSNPSQGARRPASSARRHKELWVRALQWRRGHPRIHAGKDNHSHAGHPGACNSSFLALSSACRWSVCCRAQASSSTR